MKSNSKEEMKNAILDAVISCRRESQTNEIQQTQIAAKVGISVRTLNRYFPNREEMLSLASAKYLGIFYKKLDEKRSTILKQCKSGYERLFAFLNLQRDFYNQETSSAIMFVEANINCILYGVKNSQFSNSLGNALHNGVFSDIKLGISDGSIRDDLNVNVIMCLITASINGIVQRIVFINNSNLEVRDKDEILKAFDVYIDMLKLYLLPIHKV